MMTTTDLLNKHCKACEGEVRALGSEEVSEMLRTLSGWAYADGEIRKTYRFRDFYQTMGFANAVAWIANHEDHHPDLQISYNTCTVRYSTHAVHGLTENDFICAAKVEALVE